MSGPAIFETLHPDGKAATEFSRADLADLASWTSRLRLRTVRGYVTREIVLALPPARSRYRPHQLPT